jgi:hypothetical protein
MSSVLSRRTALAACASLVVLAEDATAAAPENARPDPAAATRWMTAWMQAPRAVTNPLYVGRFRDPIYFVLQEIGWQSSGSQRALPAVKVPPGFVSDLASVPRLFWSALRPDGDYAYAAIIHDYLYWFQPMSRDDADLVFKYAMEDLGVSSSTADGIYSLVQDFGGSAWSNNAKLRRSGEKRVLAKYPDRPQITWEEWRTTPGTLR